MQTSTAGQQLSGSGGPNGGHHQRSMAGGPLASLVATGGRTTGYLAVTGLIAWVVYSEFGLAILRKAWLNLNLMWATALVVTGLVTLVK
jgi:hypothetical protein